MVRTQPTQRPNSDLLAAHAAPNRECGSFERRKEASPPLESNARTFLHLTVNLHTMPRKLAEDAEEFEMDVVVKYLLGLHNAAPFVRGGLEQGKRRALLDYRRYKKGVVLLLSYADVKLSDPTMQHLKTGDIETLSADEDNAWAFATHLTIGYQRTPEGYYHALLEQVPNLSRTAVQQFLNHFARKHSWEYDDKKVWPSFDFTGEMSSELRKALEDGRMTGVDLIVDRPQKHLGVGEEGFVTKEEALRFQLPKERAVRAAFQKKDQMGVLTRVLRIANAEDYSTVRVRLNNSSDRTLPGQVDIPADAKDAADTLYIRRTRKTFGDRLANAHAEVVDAIARYSIKQVVSKVEE